MPARKASGAAVVESVVPTPVVSRTPTILLVDDDESVRVTMQAVLEMDGYRVTPVSKGSDALELLAEREFDLVLTDLRLDDLDGIAILEEIKQRWPDTVAVLLTGYASLESAVKALRQGAYDYLFKPTDVEELRATVARGIEKRQLTQALRLRVAELERANGTIRELNADLQRRVDEATAALRERMEELARARDEIAGLYREAQRHVEQLEELGRLKSQFLSMASHELKTPLTAMSGFTQLALRRTRRRLELGYPTEEEWAQEQAVLAQHLDALTRQTGKLARLVDELLDVSRIEQGKIEFEFTQFDLAELIGELTNRMQTTTTSHHVVFEAPAAATVITADRDHLEQVLNNLLANAIKYSPGGGTIGVRLAEQDGEVVVSVSDQGVGIAASELGQVFELFYRARDNKAAHAGGMGLGLYISKEIVQRHGGRIWVESELGQGSTFYVALPRDATKSPARSR